jgi:hypothetical protein
MPFAGGQALKYSGLIAGSGLTVSTAQYKFVKISADNTVVLCAATTDIPCGVLQAPVQAAGDPVEVVYEGETLLQADTSLTAGNVVATAADGQGQVAVATQYPVGQVINVAGATSAGNLVTAVVSCAKPIVKA